MMEERGRERAYMMEGEGEGGGIHDGGRGGGRGHT